MCKLCDSLGLPVEHISVTVLAVDSPRVWTMKFSIWWHIRMAAGVFDKVEEAYPQGAD